MDPGCPTSKLHLQYSSPQPLSQQLEPDIVVSENHQQIQPNHQKKKKKHFHLCRFSFIFILLSTPDEKSRIMGSTKRARMCAHMHVLCPHVCLCNAISHSVSVCTSQPPLPAEPTREISHYFTSTGHCL
jgi:hypothetical protein